MLSKLETIKDINEFVLKIKCDFNIQKIVCIIY